ncbi:hypothetical protein BCR41DRAFT_361797 [Lobosporangium transversale]|uniref:Chitin-binding type-4 domain-containing protein n=1 Tax=Lobosporangium transversale TaxID=64571 RepID=A0A1Y2GEM9_9FUNG|nr:hypothetical protein BCR41DRAFT_361797 [Lobosporangium transversale]ORZ05567.1 hypothetical protein BCR41DRAFT_361797 [Lobosporangium transversale]|eukprot:XP_021877141.1 hypothetical protein BCR41DRAFT_361797 [Lobosporangium transversale]
MLILSVIALLLFQTSVITVAYGHSWLDCSKTLPSGKCAGFPIGYPSRANPDINTLYTYLISGRPPKAPVCQPGRQSVFPGNNPAQFPPATAAPGQKLHLTWQANGHMNFVKSPTEFRTKVQVYWTGKSNRLIKTREELANKKLLLSEMDFATPQNCDDPANPNTVCHGYVTIPKKAKPGRYQMVWWWRFDKNPIGEEYSTCFEVIVKAAKKP